MRSVSAHVARLCILLGFVPLGNVARAQQSDESPLSRIHWANGPVIGRLGDVAEVKVPATCRFTDTAGAKEFMELTQNPPTGDEQGILLCRSAAADTSLWFVVFTYSASGRVKDDEKSSLDQRAILKTIQRGTEAGNGERRRRGWSEIEVIGWQRTPYYDEETHNLTWSTRLREKGSSAEETINHSVRLLGRGGVMNADLVADPSQTEDAVEAFDAILKNYSFAEGQRYAEWRPGDKVAEYGLTALIAGGAGVAAVKLGLLGKLWKLIVAIVLALKKLVIVVVLGIVGFFKKLFSRRQNSSEPQSAGTGGAAPPR